MRWFGAVIVCLLSAGALAGPPVILGEPQVAQYRQAAGAAARVLSAARQVDVAQVDVAQADAAEQVRDAAVVVAVGHKALAFARQQAPQVPVVFCMVLGARASTFGPQVTGVPLATDPRATLEHIRQVVPGARRVGVLYNPEVSDFVVEHARKAAEGMGLSLVATPVTPLQLKESVGRLVGQVDVLWLPPDPKLFSREVFTFLLGLSAERKLPLIGFLDSLTHAGALASVSASFEDVGERAGRLAAEVLSRPESARTPVPPPVFSPGQLTINLKTARALGIEPSANALSSATHVVR